MATKPVDGAFTWATDTNFSSGPAAGNPTKVSPAGWPAVLQGSVPGSAVVAEFTNKALNNAGQWCTWVNAGSSAGAADAHIVETDASGDTEIGGVLTITGTTGTLAIGSVTAVETGDDLTWETPTGGSYVWGVNGTPRLTVTSVSVVADAVYFAAVGTDLRLRCEDGQIATIGTSSVPTALSVSATAVTPIVPVVAGAATDLRLRSPDGQVTTIGTASVATVVTVAAANVDITQHVDIGSLDVSTDLGHPYIDVVASDITLTSTTLGTVDSTLALVLAVGTYLVDCELMWYNGSGATGGFKTDFDATGTMYTNMRTMITTKLNDTSAPEVESSWDNTIGSDMGLNGVASSLNLSQVKMHVAVTVAGTLTLRVARNSAGGNDTTFSQGSWMRAMRVAS